MNIESLREYCLSKKGVEEDFPFDNDTLVFKVMGKVFALISLKRWEAGNPAINLKCDPEKAVVLREKYPETVFPGYHMNKKHWNTVQIDGGLPEQKIQRLISHSYALVANKLTKKEKETLAEMKNN